MITNWAKFFKKRQLSHLLLFVMLIVHLTLLILNHFHFPKKCRYNFSQDLETIMKKMLSNEKNYYVNISKK